MKKIVYLKSIIIRNFKNIDKAEYNLKDLNEFYGANKTGKSSVLDALRFVFYGGKNDIDKIQIGKDKTEVELSLVEDGTPMDIITSLDKSGKLKCSAVVNGVKSSNPRSLIKRMLSFGTFNPRDMINKEGRQERLLKLVPITINKNDVVIPDDGRPFPIHDPNAIDFSQHAFIVLQAIHKDMYNVRKSLNRERDIFKKSHIEREKQYNENNISFQRSYDVLPENVESSVEDSSSDLGKIKGNKKNLEDRINEQRSILKENKDRILDNQAKLDIYQNKIEEYKKGIEKMESEIKAVNAAKDLPQKQIDESQEKLNALESEYSQIDSKVAEAEKKVILSRHASRLRDEKESVDKAEKQFKAKHAEWNVMDVLIKKHWPKFVSKTLEPIKDKVPGLKIEDGGKFTYNEIPIDELSGAESIDLGIKLMKAEAKSNILVIDEFEAMDKESIAKADLKDWTVLVARVSDEPIGDGWNSFEMKNN